MSEQRPVTITAAEFVAGDYAAKIARGECVVTHLFPMELFTVHDVYEGQPNKSTGSNLYIEYMDIDDPAEVCNIRASEQLTVTWLPQPEREEAAAREFADGWQAAEIARLQAELAQVTHERDALREAMESILTVFGSLPIRSAYTPQQHYLVGQAYDIARDALKGKVQASEPDHK